MPPPSESEAETQTTISSPSQKFVPQEDDEETLWEVICITGEKNGLYKVRWKGVDPKTRKPWPQSWVRKSDCTDDLVREWRRQKKEKEKAKGERTIRDKSYVLMAGTAFSIQTKFRCVEKIRTRLNIFDGGQRLVFEAACRFDFEINPSFDINYNHDSGSCCNQQTASYKCWCDSVHGDRYTYWTQTTSEGCYRGRGS
jgi:hypothetical protein